MKARVFLIIVVLIIGVALTVVGTLQISEGYQLSNIENSQMKGELVPFTVNISKPFDIQLGNNHFFLSYNQLTSGFNLRDYLNFGFNYPFQIRLQDGKILVTAQISNENGEMIATIANNMWGVNNNPVIAHDRNYNAYAFEVIASNSVPIIQIVFKENNRVYLGGFFYIPNGTMIINSEGLFVNPPNDLKIMPIFKYPSETHLDQLIDNSVFSVNASSITFKSGSKITSGAIILGIGAFLTAISSLVGWEQRTVIKYEIVTIIQNTKTRKRKKRTTRV